MTRAAALTEADLSVVHRAQRTARNSLEAVELQFVVARTRAAQRRDRDRPLVSRAEDEVGVRSTRRFVQPDAGPLVSRSDYRFTRAL